VVTAAGPASSPSAGPVITGGVAASARVRFIAGVPASEFAGVAGSETGRAAPASGRPLAALPWPAPVLGAVAASS
jgi:hypothetical protein